MADDGTGRRNREGADSEQSDDANPSAVPDEGEPGDESPVAQDEHSEERDEPTGEQDEQPGEQVTLSDESESEADLESSLESKLAGDPLAEPTAEPSADDPSSNPEAEQTTAEGETPDPGTEPTEPDEQPPTDPIDFVPEDVQKYERFQKMDGARYERVNEFLRDRTYITAREWAIARLCSDFRTETGVEMTKIGQNLPTLVPFMTDTYTPQAVNQARHSFEEKVRKAGATFLYGAMSGFFTAEQLDDVMYEITEIAKFLLEVEGVDLSVDEELEAEDRILSVMREVRQQSDQLRHEGIECPECGHEIGDELEM